MIFCRHCGEAIELSRRRWVTVRSGDNGGTYDYCEAVWDAKHETYGSHQP